MKKYSFIIYLLVFVWIAVSSPVIAIDLVTTITPEPTTDPDAFVIPPFPTLEIPTPVKFCELKSSRDETIYPPNSACYAEVKRTQLKVKDYPKTCIKEPIVTYNDIRGVDKEFSTANDGGDNSWEGCGNPPHDLVKNCNVYVTVTTDVSKAELGSYGPDYKTLATASSSADTIAKKYLFNSLFDRPYFDIPNTPREAWRTYWRLLPFKEQANLTAQFMNLVNLKPDVDKKTLKKINNTQYQYIDAGGSINTTTVKDLMNQLPKCLLTEPVCDDFAQAYNDLNPSTKAAYNTLIPLSFNNLRGWIALVPPKFPPRDILPNTVSRESLPYIEPIFSGLLSNKYGLLSNLQPSWLIVQSLSDLTDKNTGYDLSTGKDNYISGQFAPGENKFEDKDMDVTVADNADIALCPAYPNIYHLSAPYTYPKNPQNKDPFHIQEVQIKGSTIKWELDHPDPIVTCARERCDRDGENCYCLRWVYSCNFPAEICSETAIGGGNEECCQFKVSGSGVGKALTVFNNPKVTDIKQTVVDNPEISLYNTLIPDALLTPTPTDKKIDAPTSTHLNIKTDYSGNSAVSNPENPIYRENNLAQDTVHIIQNCWLVPGDNQKSSKCNKKIATGTGVCDGTRLKEIVGDSVTPPSSQALSYFSSSILSKLTPEVVEAYSEAEATTGVPCEVLAGIHFEEGGNEPNRSLQDGRPLSGITLIQSAILAGQELNGKAGGSISDLDTLIAALSRYNGGGNSNCQPSTSCAAASSLDRCGMTVACSSDPSACSCASISESGSCRNLCGSSSFPWPIPYNFCSPSPNEGYDDPYVTNWWKSPEHDNMYLLFAYDCTQTPPALHTRPGVLTVALSIYLSNSLNP